MQEKGKVIGSPLVRWWNIYQLFVERATRSNSPSEADISYWRDRLFTNFITYLLPTCVIALVPCLTISFASNYIFIGVFDIFAVCSIATVALSKKINLVFRKVFVVTIFYTLAIILLVKLSLLGPGTVYLLAISVLVTIFFRKRYAYASIIANLMVCVFCAFIIRYHLFGSPLAKDYNVAQWAAVFSNVIFLSWVLVLVIGNAIEGLEATVVREFQLRNELQAEVSEKIRHAEQLKESEDQYKSLFFLNPVPVWIWDVETFRVLQVNDASVRQYGYSKDEFLRLTIMDIKPKDDKIISYEEVRNATAKGEPLAIITQHRRKNGELFDVEVILNAVTFKGRATTLVIVHDITEQVSHAKAIEKQNAKLREIAFIQSHLVRAPLAKILGIVHLLTVEKSEKADLELLECLDISAKELDEMIRTISKNTDAV